ncbi:hypothetical protein CY34DRAFT_812390, partial [Suillus luteus UH-Slu-Lm8-n1]
MMKLEEIGNSPSTTWGAHTSRRLWGMFGRGLTSRQHIAWASVLISELIHLPRAERV